jgi:hypothetical protein
MTLAALGAVFAVGPIALAAGPYPPPTTGAGTVTPSRIQAGECAVFSGDGFASTTQVTVTDEGEPRGTALTDRNGRFSKELCYGADAKTGEHTLMGTGQGAEPAAASRTTALSALVPAAHAASTHTVTARLIVTGVQQTDPGNGNGNGGGGAGPAGGWGAPGAGGAPADGGISTPAPGSTSSPAPGGSTPGDPDAVDGGIIEGGGGTTIVGGTGGSSTDGRAIGGLPTTGVGALALGAIGVALVGLGCAVLLWTEQRHRRRRRRRLATA